jgi:hypothetical protein
MARARILSSLLLLLAACEVTVPWSDGSDPYAPRSFRITSSSFASVQVEWSDQAGIDGWELALRVGSGPWQAPSASQSGPTTAWVDLQGVPELTSCTLGLRTVAGSGTSSWAEVQLLHGVRPPTNVSTSARVMNTGPVTVHWTNTSGVATDVQVERKPSDDTTGLWAAVPGAVLSAGEVDDAEGPEGVQLDYRVRVGTGGQWSDWVQVWAPAIGLQAPWGLTAEYVTSGVRLRWSGTSAAAIAIATYESTDAEPALPSASADLPATAREWFDPSLPVWPSTRYRVGWYDASFIYAMTDWVPMSPFRLAGPPALDASAITTLPYASWPVRDSAGRFHGIDVEYPSVGPSTVYRATEAGWEPHVLSSALAVFSPGVLLDSGDHPHVLYERAADSYATIPEVVHEWWDGNAWSAESLGTLVRAREGTWALGAGGAVHLVYGPDAVPYPTVHRVREQGATVETVFDPSPIGTFAELGFALVTGADGTAVVARYGYLFGPNAAGAILVHTRTPDGDWSFEPAPIGTVYVSRIAMAAGSAGDVALVYAATEPGGGPEIVRSIVRAGGVWSAPEDVLTRPWAGGGDRLALAGTADLSKLVLYATASGRTQLHVWGGSGWQGGEIGPTAPAGWIGIGSSGAWALYEPGTCDASTACRYSLFVGPP